MDDMKDKIISLASELFMKQGYRATSTRQIAKTLNITQPAIYHHFKNKETLYKNVIEHFAGQIGHHLYRFIEEDTDIKTTLLNMSHYLKETHPMNFPLMMRDMKLELSPVLFSDIFIIWQTNYFKPFILLFEKNENELTSTLSTRTIVLHFLRNLAAYIDDETDSPFELDIEEFITIFLYGITKK